MSEDVLLAATAMNTTTDGVVGANRSSNAISASESAPSTAPITRAEAVPEPPVPGEGTAAPAETTTETAPPEPAGPTPEEQAKAARIARAKAAAEAEKARRRQQESMMRARMQEREALQARERELAAERADRERLSRDLEAMRSDPLTTLERLGVKPDDIARRAVQASTPESQINELREEIKRVRAEQEQERQQRAQAEHQQRQAWQAEQQRREVLRLAADAEQFPTIARHAEVRPVALLNEVEMIRREAQQRTGVEYSHAEVLKYLETDVYSKLATPKQMPVKSEPAQPQSAKTAAPAPAAPGSSTQAKTNAGAPQTLNNRVTSERASLPPDWDRLDDKAQNRILAEWLANGRFAPGG